MSSQSYDEEAEAKKSAKEADIAAKEYVRDCIKIDIRLLQEQLSALESEITAMSSGFYQISSASMQRRYDKRDKLTAKILRLQNRSKSLCR